MNNVLKNTFLLSGSAGFVLLAGFGIKMLQTRMLSPEEYGYYAFFGSVMTILVILSRSGLFTTLQVLLAESEKNNEQRQLLGIGLKFTLILALTASLLLYIMAPFMAKWFDADVEQLFRLVAPLSGVLFLRFYVSAAALGLDKQKWLASYDLISKAVFLAVLAVAYQRFDLGVEQILLLNLITLCLPFLVLIKSINPRWAVDTDIRQSFTRKWKEHGLHFYAGSVVNQATYRTDELFISYFIGTTVNGFYTLSVLLSSPLIIGSQALSDSSFKSFSGAKKIPQKVFALNTIYLLAGTSLLYAAAPYLVDWLFGSAYEIAASYTRGLLFAIFFQGLYQPFNFLTAKSQGKTIKRIAFIEGGVSIIGNIICIPLFGIWGAIGTSIFAKFVHFVAKLIAYQRYIRSDLSSN